MIAWAKFAAGVVALLNGLRTWLERRELIGMGKALQEGRAAREALERQRRAREAVRALNDPDSDISRRVRQFDRD